MAARGLKLPQLLATLPETGYAALVRPVDSPSSSKLLYRVTRTKLKYRPVARAKGEAEVEAEDIGELRAHGKVYGLTYYDGKLKLPSSPRAHPDQQIRNGLKHRWEVVNPADLDERTRAAVDAWKTVLEGGASTPAS